MRNPHKVRTFVMLEEEEITFLHRLQKLVAKVSGKKRPVPIHGVIRGVLMDYKRILELASDPDFLNAYDALKLSKRKPKSSSPENIGAGSSLDIDKLPPSM